MIPILQQTGQRIPRPSQGGEGQVWRGPGRLDNKTLFGFPHGTGVESGLTFRAFALAGSIFTGATGSTVLWTRGRNGGEVLFSTPGLAGKIIPTRGSLAYTITYCIFPHDLRSTSIDQICSTGS